MKNFRLFIGIALSEEVTDTLSQVMDRMASDLPFRRWTHPADLHVTLHFLGETPEARVEAIREVLAETASAAAPLSLALTGPGTFGPPNAPRILWCGLSEPETPGALASLQAAMAPKLAAAGCAIEDRPFRAHVTMARQGGAGCTRDDIEASWQAALEDAGIPAGQSGTAVNRRFAWTAGRITLFHSHLGRRPSYERIYEVPVG